MASKIPLVVGPDGRPEQLQSADALASSVIPAGLLTGYILGIRTSWLTANTLSVGKGLCRDYGDVAMISVVAPITVTIGANSSAGGNDAYNPGGTAATSSSTKVITGTSTNWLSTINQRQTSGTISSASTAVTGTGTSFMSEYAVGDLIGTALHGFYRVTAIASDTALTVQVAPGANFAAEVPICMENLTVKVGANNPDVVTSVTTNTNMTTASNQSGTLSGSSLLIGVPAPSIFMFVFVGQGGSGVTAFLSTQRTAALGIAGYNTAQRRVGSVLLTSTFVLVPFSQAGVGIERTVYYEDVLAGNGTRIINSGTSAAWAAAVANAVMPPSAMEGQLLLVTTAAAGSNSYIRARGVGPSTATRDFLVASASATGTVSAGWLACDRAQCYEYAGSTVSVYVEAYKESLVP